MPITAVKENTAPEQNTLTKKNIIPNTLENNSTAGAGPKTALLNTTPETAPKMMRVKKRDGSLEPVNVNKIINVVLACSSGLEEVDPMRVATKAISGLYDGASTKELDELCIRTASLLISEDPQYSKLACRLMDRYIEEEVTNQNIGNFYQSAKKAFEIHLISKKTYDFIKENKEPLNVIVNRSQSARLEYFGIRTIYDRYLLKHPHTRQVIETPQYMFLRVACGLSQNFKEAKELYDLISSLDYMPSSPTLFNSGCMRPQLSSCYLLDSPKDSLPAIYDKYKDIAMLSKYAGGIGVSFSRVRSRGSLIKGTNGCSNGIIPFLKTMDSSVAAVNQGGRRKGAACVYLETWHADIEEFLELRDNTGDENQRAFNLNLANWIPDLFMKRLEKGESWSLFDPKDVPHFTDLFGKEFEQAYLKAEQEGLAVRKVSSRTLYSRMMKTLAETGNGWMTFKDHSNKKCNQTKDKENVVHLSNLCTEILEVTSNAQTAVCNLGSINLAGFYHPIHKVDWKKLAKTTRTAVAFLDRVIDINFYPTKTSGDSNNKWRPVGLGLMGWQDLLFRLGLPFDSETALKLARDISEEIYYNAVKKSCELAGKHGPHPAFQQTRAKDLQLQFDLWGLKPKNEKRWDKLKEQIQKNGLRNSLLIAIAPTATIASITGVYEAIEPQISNLFKRETLSGEFIQINKYLVADLKAKNLWNDVIRNKIKMNDGSIQNIEEIPSALKSIYRTAWELPQKTLIDLAASRGPYIDQSQSLNLFLESPSIGKLSSMYMYAWKKGIKTCYYLRSRPATRISKVTVGDPNRTADSLENPEICESCQ